MFSMHSNQMIPQIGNDFKLCLEGLFFSLRNRAGLTPILIDHIFRIWNYNTFLEELV